MATATAPDIAGWGRRRLLGILAAVTAAAVLLGCGLGYAIYLAVGSARTGTGPVAGQTAPSGPMRSSVAQGAARRDAIAAAPMPQVPAEAMYPTAPARVAAPQIPIPAGDAPGPASVLTGFPRTPAGAVGQLAQIETTVLQAMSIRGAHRVYRAWALPGGTGAAQWALTGNVAAFLGSAQMGAALDRSATVVADPVGGLVKGTDGPDWVLACVLVQVTAVVTTRARIAYGHCERMQWAGGRWMIAPGPPPAAAPSTWPGSEAFIAAGWRSWVDAGSAADAPDRDRGDGGRR